MKKIMTIVLALIMVMSMVTVAFADTAYSYNQGTPANGNTGYKFVTNVLRGALISVSECNLSDADSKNLLAYAATRGTDTMDLVGYDIYIYKYNTKTEMWAMLNGDSPIMDSVEDEAVCIGYYVYPKNGAGRYRVEVDHYAKLGKSSESMHSISRYIDVE